MNCLESSIQPLEVHTAFKSLFVNQSLSFCIKILEWKDGLFSVIMRDQAALPGENPKWMVLGNIFY